MVAGDVRIYGLRLNLKGTLYHPDFDFVVFRFLFFLYTGNNHYQGTRDGYALVGTKPN